MCLVNIDEWLLTNVRHRLHAWTQTSRPAQVLALVSSSSMYVSVAILMNCFLLFLAASCLFLGGFFGGGAGLKELFHHQTTQEEPETVFLVILGYGEQALSL